MAHVLPPYDWSRLKEEQWPQLLPLVRPTDVEVVVVEDGGEIVASLMVMRMAHLEGLWVAPERKRTAGVIRALLRRAVEVARPWANGWCWAGAATPKMHSILRRLGGVRLEADAYAVRLQ